MSYIKQNFVDGQVLMASHLNHIEEGIVSLGESGGGLNTTSSALLINIF